MRYGPKQERHRRKWILATVFFQVLAFWLIHRGLLRLGLGFLGHVIAIGMLTWVNLGFLIWTRHDRPERPIPRWLFVSLVQPFFVWQASSALLVVPAMILLLAHWLVGGLVGGASSPVWLERLDAIAAGLACVAVVAGSYAVLIRRNWLRIRTVEVAIPSLPAEFDGYRIAHLSDLHIGNVNSPESLRRWVTETNRLEPDLVAITGDFLTFGTAFLEVTARELGRLEARDGAFASFGNHDFFTDIDALGISLERWGISVLRNTFVRLRRGEGELWLAGVDGAVDDIARHRDNLEATFGNEPPQSTAVLLAHDPTIFPVAVARGLSLVLSGHTHGGQAAIPWWPRANPAAWRYRWSSGLYRRETVWMYVHRGLGATLLPFRLGTAPEIVSVVLRRDREVRVAETSE